MVAAPGDTPDTVPLLPTEAIEALLELQVPPARGCEIEIVLPAQTPDGPLNGATVIDETILTRATATALPQTLETLYEMKLAPADPPVTTPAGLTVAIIGALLLQVPPGTVLVNVVLPPTHANMPPDMVPADTAG